jgi:hypothetical protein
VGKRWFRIGLERNDWLGFEDSIRFGPQGCVVFLRHRNRDFGVASGSERPLYEVPTFAVAYDSHPEPDVLGAKDAEIGEPRQASEIEAKHLAARCLSALAWASRGNAGRVVPGDGMMSLDPMVAATRQVAVPSERFKLPRLLDPERPDQRVALASYRAGNASSDPAWRCFQLSRILDLTGSHGASVERIEEAFESLNETVEPRARVALDRWREDGKNANDLFQLCRHKIAHAKNPTDFHPDDPRQEMSLVDVFPLIKFAAEHYMINHRGIDPPSALWRDGVLLTPFGLIPLLLPDSKRVLPRGGR